MVTEIETPKDTQENSKVIAEELLNLADEVLTSQFATDRMIARDQFVDKWNSISDCKDRLAVGKELEKLSDNAKTIFAFSDKPAGVINQLLVTDPSQRYIVIKDPFESCHKPGERQL